MIPNEIYQLASALSDEFNIDFDAAVSAAWRIHRALEGEDIILTTKEKI